MMESSLKKPYHSLELEVRDYELDLQGIVNNSVYQNYLEHGRHKFIQELGIDFQALHLRGIDPVVTRVEIDYRLSLSSTDTFTILTTLEPQGRLRYVFHQEIRRSRDGALCVQAVVTAAILRDGRPSPSPEMNEAWEAYRAKFRG